MRVSLLLGVLAWVAGCDCGPTRLVSGAGGGGGAAGGGAAGGGSAGGGSAGGGSAGGGSAGGGPAGGGSAGGAAVCTPEAPFGGGTLTFDELDGGVVVRDQYVSKGIRFSTSSTGPFVEGVFDSPVSAPRYLVGDDESVDLNAGIEYGNDLPALAIELTFVGPDAGTKATTPLISLNEVFTNVGNIARADGFDLAGDLVASAEVGGGGVASSVLTLSHAAGLHRVVVSFRADAGFEDNAGIDDVTFGPVTPCR